MHDFKQIQHFDPGDPRFLVIACLDDKLTNEMMNTPKKQMPITYNFIRRALQEINATSAALSFLILRSSKNRGDRHFRLPHALSYPITLNREKRSGFEVPLGLVKLYYLYDMPDDPTTQLRVLLMT